MIKKIQYILIAVIISLMTLPHCLSGQVIINEILCSNTSGILDSETGQFLDWIEIHNMNPDEIDFSGYLLSDDPDNPARWSVPYGTKIEAHGYLLIYADKTDQGLHTNFGLSKDGEILSLYNPNGILVDYIEFNEQKPDVSFGRSQINMLEWLYFGKPTPGKDNDLAGVPHPVKASPPQLSFSGGFYSGSVEIYLLSNPIENVKVRYTLDGSQPDDSSPILPALLTLEQTSCLRVRAFSVSTLPSDILTETYFIGEQTDLPVFSITMDPLYLWDEEIGIYVDGSNFNGQRESRNSCQKDWERPINIEFFDNSGKAIFNTQAGVQVKGRMNCEFPKKPLGVYFRSKYGNETVNYQFFPEKNVTDFSSFILRPGGADGMGDCYNGTMFRDGLLSTLLINQMDIDYEGYRPAVLFINGKYWGIHNIRERNKEDYLATNYDVDPDNLDIIENPANGGIIAGDDLHYREMLAYSRLPEMAEPQGLEGIKKRMDLQEFLNYQIAEIFVNNKDWANNNVICWRPKTDDGKWRWIFYDVEGGFGLYDTLDYEYDLFDFKEDIFLKHASLFQGLLKNPVISADFIQGFAAHLNSTFHPDRIIQIIDSLASDIEEEMTRDVIRWSGYTTNGGSNCSPISSTDQWEYHVDIMRNFARNRPDIIRDQLVYHFSLDGMVEVKLQAEGGSICINGVNYARNGKYFKNIPLTVKAIPNPGFQFIGWENNPSAPDERMVDLVSDTTLVALFAHSGESLLPHVFSDQTILDDSGSPYTARGDLIIEKDALLRISPGVEILMPQGASIYVYGILQVAGETNNPVTIRPDPNSQKRWGALVFDNAQEGSLIDNLEMLKPSLGSRDAAKFKAALSINETFVPIIGLRIDQGYKNGIYVYKEQAQIQECEIHLEKTGDYINIAESPGAIIEQCIFQGNSEQDTDAIDLDAVGPSMIRNNTFRDFSGINSDGLDIGYSQNIQIEQNVFSGISDKGISVGMGSTGVVKQNLFLNCYDGIGIKDQNSFVLADRNTFYENNTAIHCFEKDPGRGGGSAQMVNSLFAGITQIAGEADKYSSIEYSYCWSENEELPGFGNKSGNPGLLSPITGVFRLSKSSGCREAGDPQSDPDPDGTRTDIGAYYFHKDQYSDVFINELIKGQNDWTVELYNKGQQIIDARDLALSVQGSATHVIELDNYVQDEYLIVKNGFLVLHIPQEKWPLIDGNIAILSQQMPEGSILLNSLPVSSFLDSYSRGCYPDGSYQLRHFSQKTPGFENIAEGSGKGQIFINEILADNRTSIQDENKQNEDWLELYNAGDEDYFLGGLYFTDDMNDPTKHQLPANFKSDLLLVSRGFSLFWADGDEDAGSNHLNFRLDAENEELGLFRIIHPDTLLIDSLDFSNQKTDVSYGRFPDGSKDLRQFSTLTPGQSNVYLQIEAFPNNIEINIYPNPCIDFINVSMEGGIDQEVKLEILNFDGKTLLQQNLRHQVEEITNIPVSHLTTGLYIIKVTCGQTIRTAKIFKR